VQTWLWLAFFASFAVKMPMWPVHTWLPDAHVQAPTAGSVILAGVLLKMGGYGFIRFSLPMFPAASAELMWLVFALSMVAVVYTSLVALAQQDMKKLIAYSSISHMGFVTLGFFIGFQIYVNTGGTSASVTAIEGGMMQMISHGFISGALFLCVGVMYDRVHSREISAYGGVANTMPKFAGLMMLFAMANSGLPGTSGFVGEFLVILSSFQASLWIAVTAATILILGAAYTLWMCKRVIFGDIANDNVAELKDISRREGLFLTLLAVMVLLFGLWPAPLFELMHTSVEHLFAHAIQPKLG
jgi:NADH-quinone oxidoreductase subunit M